MADIFDKCIRFKRQSQIVSAADRAVAESTLFRQAPVCNAGPWIDCSGRRVLQFSTNDYLGLAGHPEVHRAAQEAVARYGINFPMGARPLTGNTALHEELEQQIADFKGTESAIVFCNGALAMMGALAALAEPRDLIILDRYAHASLVCGARISGARLRFFRHNDLDDLRKVLREAPPEQARMVVVDGVYSMQGDMAPLPEISDLCRHYGARFIVDDAHGTGVCGANGRGTAEHFGVEDRVDLHLGTFSKALATIGGFAAGNRDVLAYLRFTAPTLLFTKAMPACVVAATMAALKILRGEPERRLRLWRNRKLLQDGLTAAGYDIGSTQTPITPVQGNGTDAVYLGKALYQDFSIWANAVLYPAVPVGTSILRVIPTANHTQEDVAMLVDAMAALRRDHGAEVHGVAAAES
ncbi:MAG: pyridoxal phosphate-dependent aminotransferase family protein [Lentisphaeria bacterium]|nr:pyridoxal phosphate-dependent aminotransferase family protein [Lentisphaeria bacterium]